MIVSFSRLLMDAVWRFERRHSYRQDDFSILHTQMLTLSWCSVFLLHISNEG